MITKMNIVTGYSVQCECCKEYEESELILGKPDTVKSVTENLRKAGWSISKKGNFCPSCMKKNRLKGHIKGTAK